MVCNFCRLEKAPSAFYLGSRTKCKDCTKAAVRKNRQEKIEHYRSHDRLRDAMPGRVQARLSYQQTKAYAASHDRAVAKWRADNPERRAAHIAVSNAIRDGRLKPWPACAVPECCDKPEAHHPDYSDPLSVVWLCPSHHKLAHAIVTTEGGAEKSAFF